MSLSDLASIGSFISGIAVLISLIFLYFQLRQVNTQVRQAEKNQQAAVRQGRVNALIELNLRLTDADLLKAMRPVIAAEAVDDFVKLEQYFAYQRALFQHLAENFDQLREGLLNDRDFEGFVRSTSVLFPIASTRVAWRQLRSMFKDDFVAFMDKQLNFKSVGNDDYQLIFEGQ